ncbi:MULTISPECIES: MerR family transcriptional regulator [Massilia]|uniref:MerR regulatory family protein n=1 Tax=Massilia timonae TaxID=47229 RepID=A0A1S2NFD8_9BURK|nr:MULTISPECIES: helix-turn-helix domain-containing protein [Massilia]OIJ43112.1 merR regulatory family protein [Massilia timonae]
MQNFNIGELARAAATPAPTVRYYEKIGLLQSPARTAANYRTYGSGDLDRLIFVRRARDIGFSIDQIRNLLDLSDQREHDCGTVDCLAREHLDAIEQKIADLVALKIQLSGLLSSCGGGRVADCRIIDALSRRD